MESQGPTALGSVEPIPRPKRKARKLNYLSCSFCRKAKVKCFPENRRWPEKCIRCSSRNLDCSKPCRKNERELPSASNSSVLSSGAPRVVANSVIDTNSRDQNSPATRCEPTSSDLRNREQTRTSLLLLSVHSLTVMALEELKLISENMLKPIAHDPAWKAHTACLEGVLDEYRRFARHLKAETLKRAVGDKEVLSASLNTASSLHYLSPLTSNDRLKDDSTIRYEQSEHCGIAYVLLTQRLIEYPELIEQEASRFGRLRRELSAAIGDTLKEPDLAPHVPANVWNAQCFVPTVLLQAPPVMRDVQNDGRNDWLGRSISHLAYDAEGPVPLWTSPETYGDVLGRTVAYYACRYGDLALTRELLAGGASFRSFTATGMSALDIAAIWGHSEVFQMVHGNRSPLSDVMPFSRDCSDRDCLSWAASCGNLNIVEYLCGQSQNTFWRSGLRYNTAFRLACRFGHFEIIRKLAEHTINYDDEDEMGRTAFWYAAQGGHLDIMRLLEPFSDIDRLDKEGLTPLAEASSKGHTEAVDFLLKLKKEANPDSSLSTAPTFSQQRSVENSKRPLVLAARGGHVACFALLLHHQNSSLRGGEITSIIQAAAESKSTDIVRILRQLIPRPHPQPVRSRIMSDACFLS